MNITSINRNYQQYPQIKQQKQNNQYTSAYTTNYQANNNVNFTGMEKLIKPIRKFFQSSESYEGFNDFVRYTSGVLGKDSVEIENAICDKPKFRIEFLGSMADKYNATNFYSKEKENPDHVLDVFRMVKLPMKAHFDLIERTAFDFAQTKQILEKYPSVRKINKIVNVFKKISDIRPDNREGLNESVKRGRQVTWDLINSPNANEYIENYDKYKSFIEKNIQNEGVIAKLDSHLATKTLDMPHTEKVHKLDSMFRTVPQSSHLNTEALLPSYSEEGVKMVELLHQKIFFVPEYIEKGDGAHIANIFRTSNKQNAKVRENFLETNYFNCQRRETFPDDEFEKIDQLFTMMDENPDTMKLIKKMVNKGVKFKNAGNYIELLQNVDNSVLSRDVGRIANLTKSNWTTPYQAVKKFYEEEPQSLKGRALKFIKGFFSRKEEPENLFETVTPKVSNEHTNAFQPKRVLNPSVPVIPVPASEVEAVKVAEKTLEAEPVKEIKPRRLFRSHINREEKQPSPKKLVVINDVNSIIEKKLGSNVYADQSKTYARKATKIRLSVLPEIFDSIKETRAAARKNGTFNRRTTEKNEDALTLYNMVNGKNKRYVNYMLKVRNADGTRKYTVKDIIANLNEANKTINERKLAGKSPDANGVLNPFTPKDEKNMFSQMTNDQIALFGKLSTKKS